MPTKNKEQENLNSYKVHFVDKSVEPFHTEDDLLKVLSQADEGGYHPIVFDKNKQWVINLDNVLWIDNVTQPTPEKKK